MKKECILKVIFLAIFLIAFLLSSNAVFVSAPETGSSATCGCPQGNIKGYCPTAPKNSPPAGSYPEDCYSEDKKTCTSDSDCPACERCSPESGYCVNANPCGDCYECKESSEGTFEYQTYTPEKISIASQILNFLKNLLNNQEDTETDDDTQYYAYVPEDYSLYDFPTCTINENEDATSSSCSVLDIESSEGITGNAINNFESASNDDFLVISPTKSESEKVLSLLECLKGEIIGEWKVNDVKLKSVIFVSMGQEIPYPQYPLREIGTAPGMAGVFLYNQPIPAKYLNEIETKFGKDYIVNVYNRLYLINQMQDNGFRESERQNLKDIVARTLFYRLTGSKKDIHGITIQGVGTKYTSQNLKSIICESSKKGELESQLNKLMDNPNLKTSLENVYFYSAISHYFKEYLVKLDGWDSYIEFSSILKGNSNWDEAFQEVYITKDISNREVFVNGLTVNNQKTKDGFVDWIKKMCAKDCEEDKDVLERRNKVNKDIEKDLGENDEISRFYCSKEKDTFEYTVFKDKHKASLTLLKGGSDTSDFFDVELPNIKEKNQDIKIKLTIKPKNCKPTQGVIKVLFTHIDDDIHEPDLRGAQYVSIRMLEIIPIDDKESLYTFIPQPIQPLRRLMSKQGYSIPKKPLVNVPSPLTLPEPAKKTPQVPANVVPVDNSKPWSSSPDSEGYITDGMDEKGNYLYYLDENFQKTKDPKKVRYAPRQSHVFPTNPTGRVVSEFETDESNYDVSDSPFCNDEGCSGGCKMPEMPNTINNIPETPEIKEILDAIYSLKLNSQQSNPDKNKNNDPLSIENLEEKYFPRFTKVGESKNFILYSFDNKINQYKAKELLDSMECHFNSLSKEWYNKPNSEDAKHEEYNNPKYPRLNTQGKIPVYIHFAAQKEIKESDGIGWTLSETRDDNARMRWILIYSNQGVYECTLKHELVHAFFTYSQGPARIHHFVEEALANDYDDKSRKDKRKEIALSWINKGKFPDIKEIIYKEPQKSTEFDFESYEKQDEFYTVATYLGLFLINLKDKKTLIEFGVEGSLNSHKVLRVFMKEAVWNSAVEKHYSNNKYGIKLSNVADLKEEWEKWMRAMAKCDFNPTMIPNKPIIPSIPVTPTTPTATVSQNTPPIKTPPTTSPNSISPTGTSEPTGVKGMDDIIKENKNCLHVILFGEFDVRQISELYSFLKEKKRTTDERHKKILELEKSIKDEIGKLSIRTLSNMMDLGKEYSNNFNIFVVPMNSQDEIHKDLIKKYGDKRINPPSVIVFDNKEFKGNPKNQEEFKKIADEYIKSGECSKSPSATPTPSTTPNTPAPEPTPKPSTPSAPQTPSPEPVNPVQDIPTDVPNTPVKPTGLDLTSKDLKPNEICEPKKPEPEWCVNEPKKSKCPYTLVYDINALAPVVVGLAGPRNPKFSNSIFDAYIFFEGEPYKDYAGEKIEITKLIDSKNSKKEEVTVTYLDEKRFLISRDAEIRLNIDFLEDESNQIPEFDKVKVSLEFKPDDNPTRPFINIEYGNKKLKGLSGEKTIDLFINKDKDKKEPIKLIINPGESSIEQYFAIYGQASVSKNEELLLKFKISRNFGKDCTVQKPYYDG